jgi:hypothetical protein
MFRYVAAILVGILLSAPRRGGNLGIAELIWNSVSQVSAQWLSVAAGRR